jgi:hypothetical protein
LTFDRTARFADIGFAGLSVIGMLTAYGIWVSSTAPLDSDRAGGLTYSAAALPPETLPRRGALDRRVLPDPLSQVPLGKGNTRPGLQVALESDGTTLVGEFEDEIDPPRTVLGGVDASTCVVQGVPP